MVIVQEWLSSPLHHTITHTSHCLHHTITHHLHCIILLTSIFTFQMVSLESCLELENQEPPDTTGDPIYDLLPPQEYIIAFVVPALIIVGMLLLAVLIACVLHK